jgi:hypothetical protein
MFFYSSNEMGKYIKMVDEYRVSPIIKYITIDYSVINPWFRLTEYPIIADYCFVTESYFIAYSEQKALFHQAIITLKPTDNVLSDLNQKYKLVIEWLKPGKKYSLYRYQATYNKSVELIINDFTKIIK